MLGGAVAPLLPASAAAKQRYPEIIQSYFCSGINTEGGCHAVGASQPDAGICQAQPPCRVCHIQGTTGSGTIQTPFGVSMLARGLSGDNGSVCPALSAMGNVDSDGDGTPDLVELRDGTDPNTAADIGWTQEPTPAYGCGVAAGSRGGWLLAAASTLVALFALGRARRRA